MKQSCVFLLPAVLMLAACAPRNVTKPNVRAAAVDVAASAPSEPGLIKQSDEVIQQTDEKLLAQAEALRQNIQSKGFKQLSGDAQYNILRRAARLAEALGQTKSAYDYVVRINGMPQARYADRAAHVQLAVRLGREADVIDALTALVGRWPERITEVGDDFILQSVFLSNQQSHGMAFPLLQALYDAHWKLKGDIEPSEAWRDLSLLLLERNERTKAIDVAAHVMDVYVLIAMRADRRFDPVVEADPAQFDIDAAADRQVRYFQSAAEKAPTSLALQSRAIEALHLQQHYGAMLAASDAVLLQLQSTNFPEKVYEDYVDEYPGFLEDRAIALEFEGRWDDAVAQMATASKMYEKGGGNVSQVIDLGQLYCQLGRPSDALSAIGDLTAKPSRYGDMAVDEIKIDAAAQLGNGTLASRLLEAMSVRRKDSPAQFESALIAADQLDRAAHWLVERLTDRDERQDALESVQTYLSAPSTPRQADLDARWRGVIGRREVQAALRKVGRVESYRVSEPL